ncbi:MAG: 2-amino-4-hydroxy-6-hydroxymethyldihydropteridine diphosphokinase [Ignavibacterium sp.]|nr:2-amino-4-hydroxy-6-hydroxymethyldihydropteridine diphosphokinase [Ignavibacterium sp.]MCX7611686.1 2-amino-4-hydroxy-6-hydroxymethyldihydropteridine diphosphokinase [Ignavibacterium sp.]MDW8375730.1 2-amino-4-hydroxy-6-hydroxymethyldihydropteridine diphosphokinase [Ignavibacteriales bacterium]
MKSSYHICYISLGSNIGDRFEFLQKAVKLIEDDKNIRLINASSVYETLPFGNVNQDNFLNAVIEIFTSLPPKNLLFRLKEIETEIGRNSTSKWGPREIDLDIILYEDFLIEDGELSLPHPGLYQRDFFLVPLIELNSKLREPKFGKGLDEILSHLEKRNIIQKVNKTLSFKEKSIEEKY